MVFLDHVQNLHIHPEKTHKDFGAHCMKCKFIQVLITAYRPYLLCVNGARPCLEIRPLCGGHCELGGLFLYGCDHHSCCLQL